MVRLDRPLQPNHVAVNLEPTIDTGSREYSRAITVISLVHRAEKLKPSRPNMTTKAISMPVLVAKPQRQMHDNAVPKQESEMTSRRDVLSDRYPRSRRPGIEAATRANETISYSGRR